MYPSNIHGGLLFMQDGAPSYAAADKIEELKEASRFLNGRLFAGFELNWELLLELAKNYVGEKWRGDVVLWLVRIGEAAWEAVPECCKAVIEING